MRSEAYNSAAFATIIADHQAKRTSFWFIVWIYRRISGVIGLPR